MLEAKLFAVDVDGGRDVWQWMPTTSADFGDFSDFSELRRRSLDRAEDADAVLGRGGIEWVPMAREG